MMTASSYLFDDLVGSKYSASRASCHWMLNPYVFCAITSGSGFQATSRLYRPARSSLHQTSAVAKAAPFLQHTWLRVRMKSSETRAILLLIADVSEHLWPGPRLTTPRKSVS
jgi:hypothetical protein